MSQKPSTILQAIIIHTKYHINFLVADDTSGRKTGSLDASSRLLKLSIRLFPSIVSDFAGTFHIVSSASCVSSQHVTLVETTVVETTLVEITVVEMTVVKTTVVEMTVVEMTVVEMTVVDMTLD